jgi:hypothetical protein
LKRRAFALPAQAQNLVTDREATDLKLGFAESAAQDGRPAGSASKQRQGIGAAVRCGELRRQRRGNPSRPQGLLQAAE